MSNQIKVLYITAVVLTSLLIVGCSEQSTTKEVNSEEKTVEEASEPPSKSQDEINAELKKEAIQAEFSAINGDEISEDTKVYVEGIASSFINDGIFTEFLLSSEEGDGYGIYKVYTQADMKDFEEEVRITIYGVYEGKDEDDGLPIIFAPLIEKE